jgi:hypothetical protein
MTRIEDNRELALRVGYAATDWTYPITYEAYLWVMREWAVQAVVRDDECIGAVYRKGDELHVSILPQWRGKWATKGLLRTLFNAQRITTKVAAVHGYMSKILARVGFVDAGNGEFVKEH